MDLTDNPSPDESYLFKNPVAVDEKKFEKLKKKFGPTNKNFVGESNETKNANRWNIGQLSHKQLKDKLDIVKNVSNKKNNTRNDKVGFNKKNDYTPDRNAVRNFFFKMW